MFLKQEKPEMDDFKENKQKEKQQKISIFQAYILKNVRSLPVLPISLDHKIIFFNVWITLALHFPLLLTT